MIFDKQNMFDEDAAITVTRDSTNIIDLGVQTPNMAGSVVGTLDIAIIVKESFTADVRQHSRYATATSANDDLDTPTKLARVTLALADLAIRPDANRPSSSASDDPALSRAYLHGRQWPDDRGKDHCGDRGRCAVEPRLPEKLRGCLSDGWRASARIFTTNPNLEGENDHGSIRNLPGAAQA